MRKSNFKLFKTYFLFKSHSLQAESNVLKEVQMLGVGEKTLFKVQTETALSDKLVWDGINKI